MWKYVRTNKVFEGLTVYKAFCFGEFSHYCYKEPAYILRPSKRMVKGRLVTGYKEVRFGSKHTPFIRLCDDNNGNKYYMSNDELESLFENRAS